MKRKIQTISVSETLTLLRKGGISSHESMRIAQQLATSTPDFRGVVVDSRKVYKEIGRRVLASGGLKIR